jgi:hypothetical protein
VQLIAYTFSVPNIKRDEFHLAELVKKLNAPGLNTSTVLAVEFLGKSKKMANTIFLGKPNSLYFSLTAA